MKPRGCATVLAVALGNQRLGLAVVTREHLLSFATIDAWKGGNHEARLDVVRRSVTRRLLTFEVTQIVIVAPALGETPFTRAVRTFLRGYGTAKAIGVSNYTRSEVKDSQVAGARSFHLMSMRIAARYPELAARVRARREIPGYRGIPTCHDEYNRWIFLAVAAGEQALADSLVPEFPRGSGLE